MKLLGVDTESLALTIVGVAVSLLLALAVWLRRWQRLTVSAEPQAGSPSSRRRGLHGA